MQVLSRQRGISLIEVMMAVLIFSIGLIGLAGLLVMATRSNHEGYLRTQVSFIAGNMADRMSANPMGVWNGLYNTATHALPKAGGADACLDKACTPAELATRDLGKFSDQLAIFLPNGSATIACNAANAGYNAASQYAQRPPYGGTCSMVLKWQEREAGDVKNSDSVTQTYAWEFQP